MAKVRICLCCGEAIPEGHGAYYIGTIGPYHFECYKKKRKRMTDDLC